MPNFSKKDISIFQKLYLKYYQKELNREQAIVKINALIELLSLTIEVEKSIKKNPNSNISELD